jgi:hypothetical protein
VTATWPESQGRAVVYARSGGACELRGVHRAESWSHRMAKSRGGLWRPSNGLHLCGSGTTGCHGWLEAHPLWAGEGGWHIRRLHTANPLDIPVYLRPTGMEPGWFLLDDAGGRWPIDPADYGRPAVPAHVPPAARPLHTVPWVDPR